MRKLSIIAFWGGLWGLTEATLGHLLHLFAFPIGGFVWYPLAFGFMWIVYRQIGQPSAVLYTALVAATIKLANLLMPVPLDYVINPAISILLEGMALFLVSVVIAPYNQERLSGLGPIFITNIIWRAFYILYLLVLPPGFAKASQLGGIMPFLQFFLFESIVNSLVIYGVLRFLPKRQTGVAPSRFCPHPLVAFGILGIAFLIQLRF